MKTKLALLGLLALFALPASCAPATARPAVTSQRSAHHYARTFRHQHHVRRVVHHRHRFAHRTGVAGRPHAWCGWYLANKLGITGALNRSLWVAANWSHWGRPASPAPGVVVVWPHHVGQLVAPDTKGRWLVNSGNDGNEIRTRPRSLAGAIAFRTS